MLISRNLIVQLSLITSLSFLVSLWLGENLRISLASIDFWGVMIYMGVITSGLTFLFQNWGQKQVSPHTTAIIFALDPLFALLFASFIIGNEALTLKEIVGCIFIFAAIILVVLKRDKKEEKLG